MPKQITLVDPFTDEVLFSGYSAMEPAANTAEPTVSAADALAVLDALDARGSMHAVNAFDAGEDRDDNAEARDMGEGSGLYNVRTRKRAA